MIGLRTSRNTVAKGVSLLLRVKENIDEFRQKIKIDREEIKSRVEDIAPLKVIFAELDGIFEDFENILPENILNKEWDYLFPKIIQSMLDIENFMKNQFLEIEGFNPNVELSAYRSFKESVIRLKEIGKNQEVPLKPSPGSNLLIPNSISEVDDQQVINEQYAVKEDLLEEEQSTDEAEEYLLKIQQKNRKETQ
ncbi:hypothetical protein CMI47_01965 [Candidatus Pacearchaeota archaeon]|nr:hypothetical protein [Candidatus Pacearchaeota archaeon]